MTPFQIVYGLMKQFYVYYFDNTPTVAAEATLAELCSSRA